MLDVKFGRIPAKAKTLWKPPGFMNVIAKSGLQERQKERPILVQ